MPVLPQAHVLAVPRGQGVAHALIAAAMARLMCSARTRPMGRAAGDNAQIISA